MKQIIGIGNALVDIMTLIDDDRLLEQLSLPKGSMQLVDQDRSVQIHNETARFESTRRSGGSAANTVHGLAMLGAETGFIGSIGRDETGDLFENDMREAGVNLLLFRRDKVTGTAIAFVSPDSQRTFATHLGAAVELNKDEIKSEFFSKYKILYIEGYLISDPGLVEKVCRIAKDNSMEIALDLASYNVVEANIDIFNSIIDNYIDILFANEEEAIALTGLEPLDALNEIGERCSIAVVKTGEKGSLIKRGDEIIRIDSLPVKCIDTTGAGDLYAAGFLYAYSNDLSLEKCGLLSALLAGRVIETIGARIELNRWPSLREEVSSLINGNN